MIDRSICGPTVQRATTVPWMPPVLETRKVSDNAYKELLEKTKSELQQLHCFIMKGWPESKRHIPEAVSGFWTFRDELYAQDGLLFRAERIIVPPSMHSFVLNRLHIGAFRVRANKGKRRQSVFWPGINSAIDEMIQRCTACLKYSKRQQREPMIPHTVPERPWQVVGMDYFYHNGQE